MTTPTSQEWGLRHDITPCSGARRAQEGNCLHYPGGRAGRYGTFISGQLRAPDRRFPAFIREPESALRSGELDPNNAHTIRREKDGLICEADTPGSCGYVYVSVYPVSRPD